MHNCSASGRWRLGQSMLKYRKFEQILLDCDESMSIKNHIGRTAPHRIQRTAVFLFHNLIDLHYWVYKRIIALIGWQVAAAKHWQNQREDEKNEHIWIRNVNRTKLRNVQKIWIFFNSSLAHNFILIFSFSYLRFSWIYWINRKISQISWERGERKKQEKKRRTELT